MTTRYLDKLFKPSSIAVIGASNKPGRVGNIVMHNILQGGFDGPVMPVNPKYAAVAGVLTYPNIESLPITPDMAVICTPPKAIPALIRDLGNRGTRAAIVLTAGLESAKTDDGVPVSQAMLDAAKPNLLRILGSNCLGILLPGIKLNASFSHLPAVEGRLAFVSQSGALCTAVLDWACLHDTGFSHLISLGNMSDIDFGDVIDYLAGDPKTDAILLYIEAITDGRKFMSACRAAARNKPVLAIKSGVAPEGAKAATTHTGALAGSDRVYDAVFQRAGLLRVHDIEELFNAVETLSRAQLQKGDRLAILTNGGGIGVMATDQLIDAGGTLASLSDDTLSRLNVDLPKTWSHRNPVDIIGDAPGTRYANALRTLVDSPDCDAVLVMHAPTATANSVEAATAVIDVAKTSKINVLANWVGGVAVEPGRKLFREAGVPSFDTPRRAIQAFTQMVAYRRSQAILMEVPPSTPRDFTRSTDTVRAIIQDRLTKDSHMMNEAEAKMVLAAYDIPTVETHIAETPSVAARRASDIGFPVALKIISDDITHKSDVGGVALNLSSKNAVLAAARQMLKTVACQAPDSVIEGFSIQRMIERHGSHEIFMGVTNDPVFGPVIAFGQGGIAVEIVDDSAVALPPLNMKLARELIGRTRIAKLLD